MPYRVNKDQDLVAAKKNAVRVIWPSVPGYGKPRRNTAKRSAISLINRQKPRFPRATDRSLNKRRGISGERSRNQMEKRLSPLFPPRHQS